MSDERETFVRVMLVLFTMLASVLGISFLADSSENDFRRFRIRLGLASETEKAQQDRDKEIDKRTAQIIRERGWMKDAAHNEAVKQYQADLKETGI